MATGCRAVRAGQLFGAGQPLGALHPSGAHRLAASLPSSPARCARRRGSLASFHAAPPRFETGRPSSWSPWSLMRCTPYCPKAFWPQEDAGSATLGGHVSVIDYACGRRGAQILRGGSGWRWSRAESSQRGFARVHAEGGKLAGGPQDAAETPPPPPRCSIGPQPLAGRRERHAGNQLVGRPRERETRCDEEGRGGGQWRAVLASAGALTPAPAKPAPWWWSLGSRLAGVPGWLGVARGVPVRIAPQVCFLYLSRRSPERG